MFYANINFPLQRYIFFSNKPQMIAELIVIPERGRNDNKETAYGECFPANFVIDYDIGGNTANIILASCSPTPFKIDKVDEKGFVVIANNRHNFSRCATA